MRRSMRLAIIAACLSPSPALSATPAASASQTAVMRAAREFNSAVAANDTRGIERATADDWRLIDGDGRSIPRAAFLEVIASGKLRHSGLSTSGESVRVYGNAAIVTANAKSTGTYAGAAFATDEISTDIWIRTKNGWRCVLTQLTARKR
ncbi:MAG TPA: nuclear transport factor 2 family protein [Allosphingosinicella sp.]|nr:nuclear transport factor 2 family protein [Allosphingosinicella sp.]